MNGYVIFRIAVRIVAGGEAYNAGGNGGLRRHCRQFGKFWRFRRLRRNGIFIVRLGVCRSDIEIDAHTANDDDHTAGEADNAVSFVGFEHVVAVFDENGIVGGNSVDIIGAAGEVIDVAAAGIERD